MKNLPTNMKSIKDSEIDFNEIKLTVNPVGYQQYKYTNNEYNIFIPQGTSYKPTIELLDIPDFKDDILIQKFYTPELSYKIYAGELSKRKLVAEGDCLDNLNEITTSTPIDFYTQLKDELRIELYIYNKTTCSGFSKIITLLPVNDIESIFEISNSNGECLNFALSNVNAYKKSIDESRITYILFYKQKDSSEEFKFANLLKYDSNLSSCYVEKANLPSDVKTSGHIDFEFRVISMLEYGNEGNIKTTTPAGKSIIYNKDKTTDVDYPDIEYGYIYSNICYDDPDFVEFEVNFYAYKTGTYTECTDYTYLIKYYGYEDEQNWEWDIPSITGYSGNKKLKLPNGYCYNFSIALVEPFSGKLVSEYLYEIKRYADPEDYNFSLDFYSELNYLPDYDANIIYDNVPPKFSLNPEKESYPNLAMYQMFPNKVFFKAPVPDYSIQESYKYDDFKNEISLNKDCTEYLISSKHLYNFNENINTETMPLNLHAYNYYIVDRAYGSSLSSANKIKEEKNAYFGGGILSVPYDTNITWETNLFLKFADANNNEKLYSVAAMTSKQILLNSNIVNVVPIVHIDETTKNIKVKTTGFNTYSELSNMVLAYELWSEASYCWSPIIDSRDWNTSNTNYLDYTTNDKTFKTVNLDPSYGGYNPDTFIRVGFKYFQYKKDKYGEKTKDIINQVFSKTVYVFPNYELKELECSTKKVVENVDGSVTCYSNQPVLIQTVYNYRNLGDDVSDWETLGVEPTEPGAVRQYGQDNKYNEAKFVIPIDYIPNGRWYTVIVHFADGTSKMLEPRYKN